MKYVKELEEVEVFHEKLIELEEITIINIIKKTALDHLTDVELPIKLSFG